jgi:hypothetical protein
VSGFQGLDWKLLLGVDNKPTLQTDIQMWAQHASSACLYMACPCAFTVMSPYLGQPGHERTLPVHITNSKAALPACIHRGNNVVRKVDLTSGDYTVTTIAGSGESGPGFVDGKACPLDLLTGTPHCTLLHPWIG